MKKKKKFKRMNRVGHWKGNRRTLGAKMRLGAVLRCSRMKREGARQAKTVKSARSTWTFLHAGSRDIQNIQNEDP